MPALPRILFLPGASGNTDFWKPVAALLDRPAEQVRHIGWPGVGPTPADASVTSVDDLVRRVVSQLDGPTALVAQSMGCVVALRVALEQPGLVTHLVLAALSGGIDMQRHGARDWRPPRDEIDASNPAHVFAAHHEDLAPRLPTVRAPCLLLWGDDDPLSPVAVGRWLATTLPRARLHVVPGGTHTFCLDHADQVAPHIRAHLSAA